MKIGPIDLTEKILIIAEIGNNHEGDMGAARELVDRAAQCGVDAVKFQTFKTEHYVSRAETERFKRVKSFELTEDNFAELADRARDKGLLFVSTPFDLISARMLEPLVDAFKIASGDSTFYPLLKQTARTRKPLIISTGVTALEQIKKTVEFVRQQQAEAGATANQLALLHCVSSYPVPLEQANLRTITYLADQFPGVAIGYSDHTDGIESAVLAAALGARLIEEHFTLDKQYSDFRDHQLSSDPMDITRLVTQVRAAEKMLGSYGKTIQPSEADAVDAIRRSIIAARDLAKGWVMTADDITWVRPAGGLAPGEEAVLIGKKLKRDVKAGERLLAKDVAAVKQRERAKAGA